MKPARFRKRQHGKESTLNRTTLDTGEIIFDPRGIVDAEPRPLAPRLGSLDGIRLGVLDNSKWNASKLLHKVVSLLEKDHEFAQVTRYKKESFARAAAAELVERMADECDAVVTAIGD